MRSCGGQLRIRPHPFKAGVFPRAPFSGASFVAIFSFTRTQYNLRLARSQFCENGSPSVFPGCHCLKLDLAPEFSFLANSPPQSQIDSACPTPVKSGVSLAHTFLAQVLLRCFSSTRAQYSLRLARGQFCEKWFTFRLPTLAHTFLARVFCCDVFPSCAHNPSCAWRRANFVKMVHSPSSKALLRRARSASLPHLWPK